MTTDQQSSPSPLRSSVRIGMGRNGIWGLPQLHPLYCGSKCWVGRSVLKYIVVKVDALIAPKR